MTDCVAISHFELSFSSSTLKKNGILKINQDISELTFHKQNIRKDNKSPTQTSSQQQALHFFCFAFSCNRVHQQSHPELLI